MRTSLAQVFDRAVERAASDARGIADPEGIFVAVEFARVDVMPHGWKLHVSATPFNAEQVLEACVGVLLEARVPFKFAASVDRLIELNGGVGGLGQVGKFITVYPPSAEVAVEIARALDQVTTGERGPSVLTDRALSPTSIVHYRYAGFVEGSDVSEPPDDPFVAAGLVDVRSQMVVGGRYLITATLHKAIRGAIQLAVDTKEKRSCILKRAWRDALMTPDGRDARDRLRDEAELLQRLQQDGHFPGVGEVFEDFGDLFVAMEFIEGVTLARAVTENAMQLGVLEFGRDLAGGLHAMHRAGFVHRDLNPANVIVNGGVRLIDLELARPIGAPPTEYAAGTEGYVSDNQRRGGPAAVADDLYGLGCLMFFVATGRDPAPAMTTAQIEEALGSRSGAVSEVIGGLLDQAAPRFSSAEDVLALLATSPTR